MNKAIVVIAISLTLGCTQQNHRIGQPNVVFILADDLGWADLPVYGNLFNEAPNLTTLANQGMRFTNAYAACPVCSPTRASIQSGQYPARVGVIDFIPGHWRPYEKVIVPKNRTQYLPPENITMAESLRDIGYKTGYFGKWHLGGRGMKPRDQGYDVQVESPGRFFNFAEKMDPPQAFGEKVVLSEALTDLSLEFIESNKENPFFLFLAHYDVHVQLDAQPELIEKYLDKPKAQGYPSNAVYAAMIENIDTSTGRIMQKLEELDLTDNTIIIFFSDNGGLISRFDQIPLINESKQHYYEDDSLLYIASSNAPLRAEKGTLFEGGIREPLIIRWPGKVKAGTVNESLITSVDFYPTLMEIAGENSSPQLLDGESIVPILTKDQQVYERPVYWHYPVYHHDEPASAVRKGDFKLIRNLVDSTLELYNIKEDISETTNLADIEIEKRDELFVLLTTWQKEVKAEFPIPNPNFDPEKRFEWGTHPDRN